MSGGPEQTTRSNQKQKENAFTTGDTSGTSSLSPYGAAEPFLQQFFSQYLPRFQPQTGLNPAEEGAFAGARSASQFGVPESQDLVNQGFGTLSNVFNPIAGGGFLDQNNPQTQQLVSQISDAARQNTHDIWSRAGRSFSPGEAGAIAKNTTEGLAPLLFGQYNLERQNQANAANTLFGASTQAPGLYGQIGSQMMSPFNITLQQEAQRRGIPFESLSQFSNLLLPIASQFGTQNTTGNVSSRTKGTTTGRGTSNTQVASDPFQTAIGGGLGLLGLGLSPYNAAGNTLLGGLFG